MYKFIFTAILLILSSLPISAQRTMKGQPFVGASALWGGSPGVSLHAGAYLERSLWEVSLHADGHQAPLSTGDRLECLDILVSGDWQWRIVSDRSRRFLLYGGAGIFAGYEMYDPRSSLPSTVDLTFGKGVILYGISADLSSEVFLSRRFALLFGASVPLNFSSHAGRLRWRASFGIRLNL